MDALEVINHNRDNKDSRRCNWPEIDKHAIMVQHRIIISLISLVANKALRMAATITIHLARQDQGQQRQLYCLSPLEMEKSRTNKLYGAKGQEEVLLSKRKWQASFEL